MVPGTLKVLCAIQCWAVALGFKPLEDIHIKTIAMITIRLVKFPEKRISVEAKEKAVDLIEEICMAW